MQEWLEVRKLCSQELEIRLCGQKGRKQERGAGGGWAFTIFLPTQPKHPRLLVLRGFLQGQEEILQEKTLTDQVWP